MRGIEVKNLTKHYKETKALEDVSLTIEYGKIYGLLGRNGAGKSTLVNLISNRIFPTSGEIFIDGEPSIENDDVLRKVFTMSEHNLLPVDRRFKDAVKLVKVFYPELDEEYALSLAKKFDLDIKKKLIGLSTGYSSIAKLIIALASGADYVFFDEPVLGLDPNHRELFYKELIERYTETGSTFIISTHLIDECANLIEKAIIIDKGRVVTAEDTEAIMAGSFTVTGPAELVDKYIAGKQVLGSDTIGGIKSAYIKGAPENVPQGLEVSKASLQSLFIQMTND
ncbi:MAG: ABC transporter ATP-binding protein [Ruminococcus sp.]|nr:ABC transporter ATP-binding protein [Ruminococcus sp.]